MVVSRPGVYSECRARSPLLAEVGPVRRGPVRTVRDMVRSQRYSRRVDGVLGAASPLL